MAGRYVKVSGWVLAVSLAVLLATGPAMGGGITLLEFSTKGLGLSFTGGGAAADEASTIFYNPAGLTRLQAPEAQANAHVIFIQADFDDDGSTFNGALGGGPIGGGEEDGGTTVFVPSFFASMPLTDRLVAGIGVHSPYGLATDYDDDWVGRYHATSSDLLTIDVNPSIGFKVNNWLSIGGGVSARYIDAELSSQLDLGTLGGTGPGSNDGETTASGDDWGLGWNFGVLLEPMEGTRFGIHYRSKVDYTLEGDFDLDTNATGEAVALAALGLEDGADVEADITLPETVSFSAYHEFNEQWTVLADITWTNYSRLDELRIEIDGADDDSVTTLDWEDTWRYSLGVTYKPIPNLVLRAGTAYDESPVPGKKERTPRVPDDDRIWASIGFGYTWFDRLTVDVGYAHLFIGDVDIERTADPGDSDDEDFLRGNLIGSFDAAADIVGIEVRYVF